MLSQAEHRYNTRQIILKRMIEKMKNDEKIKLDAIEEENKRKEESKRASDSRVASFRSKTMERVLKLKVCSFTLIILC